jgi:hypothetical protein
MISLVTPQGPSAKTEDAGQVRPGRWGLLTPGLADASGQV